MPHNPVHTYSHRSDVCVINKLCIAVEWKIKTTSSPPLPFTPAISHFYSIDVYLSWYRLFNLPVQFTHSSPHPHGVCLVPSSEIHPSVWAPCSLHPLHRNDYNCGSGLVLVVGAGVPESKVWEEPVTFWCTTYTQWIISSAETAPRKSELPLFYGALQSCSFNLIIFHILQWDEKLFLWKLISTPAQSASPRAESS